MASYQKTRELTIGPAGTALSVYHLTSHQNIDSEIQDISTFLTVLGTVTACTDFTTSYTGFAADPTMTTTRYMQIGKMVTVVWTGNANGTKNGTTGLASMTLPVAPKYSQLLVNIFGYYASSYRMCAVSLTAGSTTAQFGIQNGSPDLGATPLGAIPGGAVFGFGGATNVLTYEVA